MQGDGVAEEINNFLCPRPGKAQTFQSMESLQGWKTKLRRSTLASDGFLMVLVEVPADSVVIPVKPLVDMGKAETT